MSPEIAWPLVIFGICVVWLAVVALGDWLFKRRQFDPEHCQCWICESTRARREASERQP